MSGFQIESEMQCPWCFEWIPAFVDPSQDEQSYIEDCSVCCRPIQVSAVCSDGELVSLDAARS
jgi:hypothetical protein